MKENFSKRVQSIIKYAKDEAIRLGHSYVGSEHLLLGMIKDSTGLSIKILEIYDCSLVNLKAMIEDMIKSSCGTLLKIENGRHRSWKALDLVMLEWLRHLVVLLMSSSYAGIGGVLTILFTGKTTV